LDHSSHKQKPPALCGFRKEQGAKLNLPLLQNAADQALLSKEL